MRLFIFPPSARVLAIVALKDYLNIECEIVRIDLSKGDQCTPDYAARNPNQKMPMLEDDDFVLWESNAILFYLANRKPHSGLWPSDLKGQANVLRWLAWESAHWDAESVGMVAYETASKTVFGLGPPDLSFVARGQQNFARFAAVLNKSLKGRAWLTGDNLTIAELFDCGAGAVGGTPCSFRSRNTLRSHGGTLHSTHCRRGAARSKQRMHRWLHGKPRTPTIEHINGDPLHQPAMGGRRGDYL